MGYEISEPFKEDGLEKVVIKATEGSRKLFSLKKNKFLEEKIFEVVKKEKIYEWIAIGKPVDLKNKYIKGFSLSEYRRREGSGDYDEVVLKNFNAAFAFFDWGAEFFYAVFEGDTSFWNASFENGDVIFSSASFGKGRVPFQMANFGEGDVLFNDATFAEGDISFLDSIFEKGKADFSGITFGNGNVSFRGAKFRDGDLSFEHTNFGKADVSFEDVNFGEGCMFFASLKVLGDWDMRVKKADVIDFSNSLIHGTLNFTGANINQLKLVNTQLTGKIFVGAGELLLGRKAKSKADVINIQQDTTHKEKREQFRLLKENFRSLGQYEDEDSAYFWLKYHEIRDEAEIKKGDNCKIRFKKKLVYGFKRVVFELMGKYGIAPRNVAVSMFVVLVLFSGIYYKYFELLLPSGEGNETIINKASKALYHSIITFLTIGYGDCYPHGILRFLSGIEGFLGLFLMAYFTVSFARKVLR